MRVIVAGMIAGTPHQGGAAWAVLQYILGLHRLGHQVFFVEPVSGSSAAACAPGSEESRRYLYGVATAYGLQERCALVNSTTRTAFGMTYEQVKAAFASADLLLNLSGILRDEHLLQAIDRRVYLDLDPGFTQLWQAVQDIDMGFAGHTHFATVGPLIGTDASPVPTCGLDWISTLQPVVLEEWPRATELCRDAFTTIANWRGYGSIDFGGAFYGQKVHSFRKFMALPGKGGDRFELALSIHPTEERDLEALNSNGWHLLDPQAVAATPSAYRKFIAGSLAEFGVAKSGYVEGATGWFSDRSICYLASGRPVLAQDTGFASLLPTSDGLLSFEDMDEAVAGVNAIRSDYPHHARAARELAEAYFDSNRVLTQLLDRIGA